MRGEETQIVGAIAAGLGDGMFVMPGTHGKWVSVSKGVIENYATSMAGEIYEALRSHTILGALMSDGAFSELGFREEVNAGMEGGFAKKGLDCDC